MPFKDKQGRTCGFLDIDEDDKRKKFLRRYFILNKPCGVLEWYTDSPSVSILINSAVTIAYVIHIFYVLNLTCSELFQLISIFNLICIFSQFRT